MRSWKKADTAAGAVFLYFRAHPKTFFTPEHVAAQVRLGQRQLIVRALSIQALRNPGFTSTVSREAAVAVYGGSELTSPGGKLFDEFKRFLEDVVEPAGATP